MSADSAALLTIEGRLRRQLGRRLEQAVTHLGGYLGSVIKANPALTGLELMSRPDVHKALLTALGGTQSTVESTIRAGYAAARSVARASASRELAAQDYQVPTEIPDRDAYLVAVLAAVALAFSAASDDIQTSVRTAYDGATGTLATAARILIVRQALHRAVRRLGVRVNASAVVALHRGHTDAMLAIYDAYRAAHPSQTLYKTWQTGSADPCPACRALNGQSVPVDAEFDRTLTADPTRPPPPVHRDLLGPPRHPNCRCRITIHASTASAAVRTHTTAAAPQRLPASMSAADVRRLPIARFTALTAFFTAAARRIRTLLRKARAGG